MMNSQKVVILAKAGIQNLLGKSWTPASAGVTDLFSGIYYGFPKSQSFTKFLIFNLIFMPITTKKGDKGFTSLLGGRRVPKFHLRPETYGTLDELNSFLGMARAVSKDRTVKETLLTIQNHLFIIGSALALSGKDRTLLKREVTQKEVDWLPRLSVAFEVSLMTEPKFIIYGETYVSSILDVARAVSRRAERRVAEMKSKRMLSNLKILEYLNRLSDVLYLLARYEERKAGVKPRHPSY